MARMISLFVQMEQLLSVIQQIGGNVILVQDFIISIMLRFRLMRVNLVNSWLSLVLKNWATSVGNNGLLGIRWMVYVCA